MLDMPGDMGALQLGLVGRQLDVLDWIATAGRDSNRAPGEIYLPELEVMFLIRCLRRRVYDDNPKAKLHRHVILVGPHDAAKSQIVETFLRDMAGAVSYLRPDREISGKPTYMLLGGGNTWERLRGGATGDGKLIMPMLHDVDFLFCSELFSFIGHTPKDMLFKIDQLNPALQERRISVALTKMASATDKQRKSFAQKCADAGIIWNDEKSSIEYDVGCFFLACTRFFTPDQDEAMRPTGFQSRNVLPEWRPDQFTLRKYYDSQFGRENLGMEQRVREFNEFAWRAKVATVAYPPRDMVDRLVVQINTHYWDISQETGMPFDRVRIGRERADVAQLLTTFAFIRALVECQARGAEPVIDALHYSAEDEARVMQFRSYQLQIAAIKAQSRAKLDDAVSKYTKPLADFVQGAVKKLQTPDDEDVGTKPSVDWHSAAVIKQSDLIAHIVASRGVSKQAAYAGVAKLREHGLLIDCQEWHRAGTWLRVGHQVMESVGMPKDYDEMVGELREMEKVEWGADERA